MGVALDWIAFKVELNSDPAARAEAGRCYWSFGCRFFPSGSLLIPVVTTIDLLRQGFIGVGHTLQ